MIGDRISGLFCFLFGFYFIREGIKVGIGRFNHPGPGFFLLLSGASLVVFSSLLMLQSILTKPKTVDREARGGKDNIWVVVFVCMGLLIYVLIFEWLGFIISTFLLVTFLLKFIEQKKWWNILLTAGVVSLSTFIIFNVIFKSGLPEGILNIFP